MRVAEAPIRAVRAAAVYTVPTHEPEADGAAARTETTLAMARVDGGGDTGLGHTYAHASNADLIRRSLASTLIGKRQDAACYGAA